MARTGQAGCLLLLCSPLRAASSFALACFVDGWVQWPDECSPDCRRCFEMMYLKRALSSAWIHHNQWTRIASEPTLKIWCWKNLSYDRACQPTGWLAHFGCYSPSGYSMARSPIVQWFESVKKHHGPSWAITRSRNPTGPIENCWTVGSHRLSTPSLSF